MTATWTDAARRALDDALAHLATSLAGDEADPAEVRDDVRRHVEEEVARRGLQVVSEEDVRAILAQVAPPGATAAIPPGPKEGPALAAPAEASDPPRRLSIGAALCLWPLAVILPAVALVFELSSRMCALALFDPLPTVWHAILVGLVPAGNAFGLVLLGRGAPVPRPLLVLHGLGLGVALYYALVFAPVVPLSVVMVVFYGLGLLSLAPLLALVAGLVLRRRLRAAAAAPGRAILGGFLLGVLALFAIGLPRAVTKYSLRQAVDGSPAERLAAVRRLRTFGDRDVLLRACYQRTGELGDLESFLFEGRGVQPEDVRPVYYRVTGQPFNAVPPPRLRGGEGLFGEWDGDQGGAAVGGVVRGLALVSSRIDGSLDGNAALGYLEWTLELHNSAPGDAEGRAVIALPPGAAVSRATLWIDGEEHEAAFGGRAAVRKAYEERVRRLRDPLLVTTAGPDRVLVQSFPVPAGGTQKLRLGITLPLPVEAPDRARLHLPQIVERNFRLDGMKHGVWIESKLALAGPGLRVERTASGATALRGDLADDALATTSIAVARDASASASWAADTVDPTGDVEQLLEPASGTSAPTDVVVLDGSVGMATVAEELRTALTANPGTPPVVLLASDAVETLRPEDVAVDRFRGGMDSVPALAAAWDRSRSRVLWIHGAQPALLSPAAPLAERCERRPGGPQLVSLAIAPGPNHVLDELDGCAWLHVAPRRGTLAEDVRALLAGAAPDGAAWVARRERRAPGVHAADARPTSNHLVRLWALDRLRSSPAAGAEDASALAVRYRLVTPRSGAVVLATAQEVRAAGLDPALPHGVPTVPEPRLVVLLAAVALLAWLALRSART